MVLAGGTARRMGGVDKALLELDGVTLLERVLAATVSASEVVVVGDQRPVARQVTWTREAPPRGGPAAGVLAALDRFALPPPDLVAVLAVDMPLLSAETVARLVAAAQTEPGIDGAVLVDPGGRRQTLAAAYRLRALLAAAPRDPLERHGLPMRRLVQGLRLAEVPAVGDEARDVDTWADLRDVRR